MPRLLVQAASVVVAATLVLSACSGEPERDTGGSPQQKGDSDSAAPTDVFVDPVQFRPVRTVTADPACALPATTPDPSAPATLCGDPGDGELSRFELDPAQLVGGVEDAEAGAAAQGEGFVVTFQLDDDAADDFESLSADLAGTDRGLAVVLEGRVLSAPMVQAPIPGGLVQILGPDLTAEGAEALADKLEDGG